MQTLSCTHIHWDPLHVMPQKSGLHICLFKCHWTACLYNDLQTHLWLKSFYQAGLNSFHLFLNIYLYASTGFILFYCASVYHHSYDYMCQSLLFLQEGQLHFLDISLRTNYMKRNVMLLCVTEYVNRYLYCILFRSGCFSCIVSLYWLLIDWLKVPSQVAFLMKCIAKYFPKKHKTV